MQPSEKPVVVIGSMARTGSMWTYNITRELLSNGGLKVLPEKVPVSTMAAILSMTDQMTSFDPGPGKIFCFKTHQHLGDLVNHSKIISPYRDVRDAILSAKKFMHCTFNQALKNGISQMQIADYYLSQSPDRVLPLRYDEIATCPITLLEKICDFPSLDIEHKVLESIAEKYSIANVKAALQKLDDVKIDDDGGLSNKEKKGRYQVVENVDKSYRVFDSSTGFQSNHITSKENGTWRTEFTAQEKKLMMKLVTPWLEKYNFPI